MSILAPGFAPAESATPKSEARYLAVRSSTRSAQRPLGALDRHPSQGPDADSAGSCRHGMAQPQSDRAVRTAPRTLSRSNPRRLSGSHLRQNRDVIENGADVVEQGEQTAGRHGTGPSAAKARLNVPTGQGGPLDEARSSSSTPCSVGGAAPESIHWFSASVSAIGPVASGMGRCLNA